MTHWNPEQTKAFGALAKIGGELSKEDDIQFEGTKYILPTKAGSIEAAAKFLMQRARDEETETAFSRQYNYRPMDGAHAVSLAIRRAFGFSVSKPIVTFFGTIPPQLISVKTGVNTQVQVPWGHLTLPGLTDTTLILDAYHNKELGACFQIQVTAPRKYRDIIEGFFNVVQDCLETDSIYRGKAIDGAGEPNFIDTGSVSPDDVVYSQDVIGQLAANVWSPIRHAKSLAALRQPSKRSVLLEGPYGSGKTLAALLTAQVAEEHGWTFLMCRPGIDDFFTTLQTARMYEPAVVFLEDVDSISEPGSGSDSVTKVLDAFDGIKAKGMRLLLCMTTNHVDRIHKGMLRPGRLDSVIHISSMDRSGVEKLVRRVVGDALDPQTDFDAVFGATHDFMPAFVKEGIDRAVRYNVALNDGVLGKIDTESLVLAMTGLRRQLELMNEAPDTGKGDTLSTLVGAVVAEKVAAVMNTSGMRSRGRDDGPAEYVFLTHDGEGNAVKQLANGK